MKTFINIVFKVRLIAEQDKPQLLSNRSNIPKMVKRKMPDFAKLHAKEFNKTETLDIYLAKKKERANALTPGPKSVTKSKPPSSVVKKPDFAKLHAKEFNKAITLENYIAKKKERANALTPGPKSAIKPVQQNMTKNKPIMAPLELSNKVPAR